jgi:amidophosphoribosyltransferase
MCGIIGIIGPEASSGEVYSGLLTLQHRGQDAAGILSYDFPTRQYSLHKDEGLVSEALAPLLKSRGTDALKGEMSIGHTRYQTVGRTGHENIQPLVMNFPYGLGMVHNGNLVNYHSLAQNLQDKSYRYSFSSNDLEAILHLFGEQLARSKKEFKPDMLQEAAQAVFRQAKGGYSVIGMIADEGMFAFRDPMGIRPLVLGKKEGAYAVASESRALNFLDYEIVRDVRPGEILFVDKEGDLKCYQCVEPTPRPCMFEYIYFANPESTMEGKSVYQTRLRFGQLLGKKIIKLQEDGVLEPDVVVPIPETSRVAAISLAETLGRPYRELFIKNPYVQRSFILKSQRERKNAIELKLSPIKSEIKGKKVLLVDDSIVRGTTSQHLIALAKKAGAKEVYFASTCPEIRHPCYFGIDFPSEQELVANNRNYEQIAQKLGAKAVVYLNQEDVREAIGKSSLCMACLDGDYPVDVSEAKTFARQREEERNK